MTLKFPGSNAGRALSHHITGHGSFSPNRIRTTMSFFFGLVFKSKLFTLPKHKSLLADNCNYRMEKRFQTERGFVLKKQCLGIGTTMHGEMQSCANVKANGDRYDRVEPRIHPGCGIPLSKSCKPAHAFCLSSGIFSLP